jgi:hypothetical protein
LSRTIRARPSSPVIRAPPRPSSKIDLAAQLSIYLLEAPDLLT